MYSGSVLQYPNASSTTLFYNPGRVSRSVAGLPNNMTNTKVALCSNVGL